KEPRSQAKTSLPASGRLPEVRTQAMTSWPSLRSRAIIAEPRNPPAPIKTIRTENLGALIDTWTLRANRHLVTGLTICLEARGSGSGKALWGQSFGRMLG